MLVPSHLSAQNYSMEKVTGIGGVFFKARDPEKLAAWYRDNLGVPLKEGSADFLWGGKATGMGRTVWCVFPADSDYFGPVSNRFMVNYRVSNLEKMLEQLRTVGIAIEKTEDHDYGRFAWLSDPEGNRIELWEPKGEVTG